MKQMTQRFLSVALLIGCFVVTLCAQPRQFSFYMLQPTAFAEVVANQPVARCSPNVKAARQKGVQLYKGTVLPVVQSNAKWMKVEQNADSKVGAAWVLKSQCRTLPVATQTACVMPPVFQVESADGTVGGMIEGPDADFQVRSEGVYRNLPFSVGHAPGSDNYMLQFMVAANNPSYTYVIATSFVVSFDAKDKPSMSVVRDVENGKVVYEMLYLNLPRTIADDQIEAYIADFLVNCADKEFAKLVETAFPTQGMVPQVTMYFKATNGKRYAYTYNSSLQPQSPHFLFKWKFVE